MTDTGHVPGEELPANAGGEAEPRPAGHPVGGSDGAGFAWQAEPNAPQPGSMYTFLDQPDGPSDDDDLFLMPGPQGSWSDPQPPRAPVPGQQPHFPEPGAAAPAAAPVPPPAAAATAAAPAAEPAPVSGPMPPAPAQVPAQGSPPRRPLHPGPPVPADSGGPVTVVRSLADRGPTTAPTPPHGVAPVPPTPARPQPAAAPASPPAGPEYLDLTREAEPPRASAAPQPQPGPHPQPQPGDGAFVSVTAARAPEAAPPIAPDPVPDQLAVPVPAAPQPVETGNVVLGTATPAAGLVVADPAFVTDQQPPQPADAGQPAPTQHAVPAAPVAAPEGTPAVADVLVPPAPAPQPAAPAAVAPEAGVSQQPQAGVAAPPIGPGAPVEASQWPEAAVANEWPNPADQPEVPAVHPAEAAVPPQPPAPDEAPGQPAPPPAEVTAAEPEGPQPAGAPTPVPVATPAEPVAAEPQPATLEPPPVAAVGAAVGYEPSVREAVHRVIRERRDVRNGFRSDPIPHEVLIRVLEAAHTAPSVGLSQPWDFVVIRSAKTRQRMHELAMRQRKAYEASLPKARAKQFKQLKVEAILETPVNIVVTADPTRGGRHTLGRHTQPQMAPYSSALAVENLWLAARAEGLGVGWVSFFDEREMVRELGLPEHLEVVAYLCVGYVDEFPEEPELMQAGWSSRRPLSWVVHEEEYGRRALPGEDPQSLLEETLRGIRPLDAKALGEAWERQKRMTKPSGSLGMLEIISAQLCGLSRQCPPPIPEPATVAVFAADHGVHAQGVTVWPQDVTAQMVANFLAGGAVVNAFANQLGAEICVVDVGVKEELPAAPGLVPRKVRPGTADFTDGPAMTREEVLRAIEVGIETARDLVAAGNRALLTGEMGVANTTSSAALIAVYTGTDPAEVTGRGAGIDDETHLRKIDVVRRALQLHQPDPSDPIGVLAAVGGLEHAATVGLLLGAASLRTPVILDGVTAGACALVARAAAPEALAACIAGHRSAEPAHAAALARLGLRPLIDLDLRLGEGTGALLALPLVQSAARAMHEVATFETAGVTQKHQ